MLDGLSQSQIAADLAYPASPVTQAILASANEITAAICTVTGQRPAAVCSAHGVDLADAKMGIHQGGLGTRRQGRSADAVSAGPAVEHHLSLDLVQPAPDAVRLTDPDGVLQTVPPHVALVADLLGPKLPSGLLFLPLCMRRRKERRRLRSSAGCFDLPRI